MNPYDLSRHSALHMTRLLNWMHDPDMVAAFALGARLKAPQTIVYVNPELFSVFQVMEQERIEQEELEQEMRSKLRAKRRKRTQHPRVEENPPK